jgi:hypothetical protein
MKDGEIKMPAHYALERDLLEQLSGRPGHQRCVVGRDELLLVLHEVPKAGIPERDAIFFWRRRDGRWFQNDGQGLDGLGGLLDRYADTIDENEKILDATDEAEDLFRILRHAGPLTRSSRNLVVALEQVLAQEPDDRLMRTYCDRAREIERAAELLHADGRETLLFRQTGAAEEHAKSAARLGNILFKLNLVTGFFLPLAAFGGLFGMNVDLPDFIQGMFWWIFLGGLGVGGGLLWYVAKESR